MNCGSSDFRVGMQSVVKDYYAELSSLRRLPATFLACPKKGGAKEGHPATILIRLARSSSVHFRNSGFALRQSEMFNPRTRSHDGSVRMGKPFKQYPKTRMSPERPYEILGHRSWPKEASRRADANCLRPKAEFSRPSERGLRPVQNFVQAAKGICKKVT